MEVKKFTCLQAQCMSSSMSFAPGNNLEMFYIECGSEFLLNTVDCFVYFFFGAGFSISIFQTSGRRHSVPFVLV
jgi:hypothetical protein